MDHQHVKRLQTELSEIFSHILGKEVNLTSEQALRVTLTLSPEYRPSSADAKYGIPIEVVVLDHVKRLPA